MKHLFTFALLVILATSARAQTISETQSFALGRPQEAVKRSLPPGYSYSTVLGDVYVYKNKAGNLIGYSYASQTQDFICATVYTFFPKQNFNAVKGKLGAKYRLYEGTFFTNPGEPLMYAVTIVDGKAALLAQKNTQY